MRAQADAGNTKPQAGRSPVSISRRSLAVTDERGVIYNLLADRWELSTDTDVNYMVLAEKAR